VKQKLSFLENTFFVFFYFCALDLHS
jgi:hypothetical protein